MLKKTTEQLCVHATIHLWSACSGVSGLLILSLVFFFFPGPFLLNGYSILELHQSPSVWQGQPRDWPAGPLRCCTGKGTGELGQAEPKGPSSPKPPLLPQDTLWLQDVSNLSKWLSPGHRPWARQLYIQLSAIVWGWVVGQAWWILENSDIENGVTNCF
jgi:hypothetical protein